MSEQIESAYAKKDIIYSSTMGLCIVSDVTKLSADKNAVPMPYYVLKSYYDKTRVAYIPVENHEVELRDVIDESTARAEFDALSEEFGQNPEYEADPLVVGELAYVMKRKPEEVLALAGFKPAEEE